MLHRIYSNTLQQLQIVFVIIFSALKDYEDALKLDPKNESLQQDADRIRNIIQGTS